MCGQCRSWQTGGRPGRYYKYLAQGQDLRFGRDQFDVVAYGLAEVSSASAPAACRRSVLSVCLQLVGDRPVSLISILLLRSDFQTSTELMKEQESFVSPARVFSLTAFALRHRL